MTSIPYRGLFALLQIARQQSLGDIDAFYLSPKTNVSDRKLTAPHIYIVFARDATSSAYSFFSFLTKPIPSQSTENCTTATHNMQGCLNSNTRLIGYAGKDGLKDAFEELGHNRQAMLDFIKGFRDLRALNHPRIRPVIPLLKLGGISSRDICVEVRAALIEIMKQQIQHLEQEQLDALLDKCYSFLTVPQLAPIGIAVLERLSYVDLGIWTQIVRNGLDESPYIDLPLSIKKRIWATEPTAFEYEVIQVINRIPEAQAPVSLEHFLIRVDRQKKRAEDPILKDLVRLASNVDADLFTKIIEKMIQTAAKEQNSASRVAIANFFHDFVVHYPAGNHNFAALRKMARYLDTFEVESQVDPTEQIDIIYDALKTPSSRATAALLISSSYSRDFLAHILVMQLLNCRGPLNTEDETVLLTAADHLRSNAYIGKLTFLSLCNMKSKTLLSEGKLPNDADVDLPFQLFYPLLIHEMDSDATRDQDHYYGANGVRPNGKFLNIAAAATGVERRVLTTYCLQLYIHGNTVGLSRFRLVLDRAFGIMDKVEEVREVTLAFGLIEKILAELHVQRSV